MLWRQDILRSLSKPFLIVYSHPVPFGALSPLPYDPSPLDSVAHPLTGVLVAGAQPARGPGSFSREAAPIAARTAAAQPERRRCLHCQPRTQVDRPC